MARNENILERQMAERFAALGSPARVKLLRLLVRAGDEGLTIGEIQSYSGLAPSTQAHHLNALVRAGVLSQEKIGREVRTRVVFAAVRAMGNYLIERCCDGLP